MTPSTSHLFIVALLAFWVGIYVRDCEIVDNQRKIERKACVEYGISKPKRYDSITLKEIKGE
jgi:hypothetical protein